MENGELTLENGKLTMENGQWRMENCNLILNNEMMNEKKENIIAKKSYEFALKIIKLYKSIVNEHKEYVISKQLLRSGTSIGALVKEAEHAQSKKDFINKMNVALKEANETEYWLQILKDSDFLKQSDFEAIYNDNTEILRLLVSIVKTSKTNL